MDLRAPGLRERRTIWNAVAGSAQIVTSGRVTVPTYRDVLTLVAVEGRGGGEGLTVSEIAALLNTSQDTPAGRRVASSLAVFAARTTPPASDYCRAVVAGPTST